MLKDYATKPLFLNNPALSLICFGGKGGVGKTTSAAATAIYLADRNPHKSILLASVDPAHSLIDSLKETIPYKNLLVWEIDARLSYNKFIEKHNHTLINIFDKGTFLDRTDASNFLSISLPGIDELMGMVELADLLEHNDYDIVVLDTAPTGHTIKFLQMPNLIKRFLHIMDLMMEKHRYMTRLYLKYYKSDATDELIESLTKSINKIERLFQSKYCEFIPVMLPDTLSIKETMSFTSILNKYDISVNNVIVNRIFPVINCSFCNKQYLFQKNHIDRIRRYYDGLNVITIPLFKDEVHGIESLLKFANTIINNTNNKVTLYDPITSSESPLPSEIKGGFGETEGKYFLPIPKPAIKFLLFGGKGGVGKTTISSATALRLSDLYPKKRILLFSTDPARSLSYCLNTAIKNNGSYITDNLFVHEMDAEKEYQKLKHLYSEEIKYILPINNENAFVDIAFDTEIMDAFIDMLPPGIDEVMALTSIIDFIDNNKFDIFILDTAPTGHLIRFLEMPELAIAWLKFFFNLFLKYRDIYRMPRLSAFMVDLSKKIKKLLALLRDSNKTLFTPISILTEMSYEETIDLINAVKCLKIPVSQLILNMAHPLLQNNIDIDCHVCRNRIAYEKKMLASFKTTFSQESVCVINKNINEAVGIKALQLLGKNMYREFSGYSLAV